MSGPSETAIDIILQTALIKGDFDRFQEMREQIQTRYQLLCPMMDEPVDPDDANELWEAACFAFLTSLPLDLRATFLLPVLTLIYVEQEGMQLKEAAEKAKFVYQDQFAQ